MIILLSTGGKTGGGYEASKYVVIALHGGILLLHALLNSLSISLVSFFGQLAAAWNVLGTKNFLLLLNINVKLPLVPSLLYLIATSSTFQFCSTIGPPWIATINLAVNHHVHCT